LRNHAGRVLAPDSHYGKTRVGSLETIFHLVKTPLRRKDGNVVIIVAVLLSCYRDGRVIMATSKRIQSEKEKSSVRCYVCAFLCKDRIFSFHCLLTSLYSCWDITIFLVGVLNVWEAVS
jgi:hypothetical protein